MQSRPGNVKSPKYRTICLIVHRPRACGPRDCRESRGGTISRAPIRSCGVAASTSPLGVPGRPGRCPFPPDRVGSGARAATWDPVPLGRGQAAAHRRGHALRHGVLPPRMPAVNRARSRSLGQEHPLLKLSASPDLHPFRGMTVQCNTPTESSVRMSPDHEIGKKWPDCVQPTSARFTGRKWGQSGFSGAGARAGREMGKPTLTPFSP